MVSSELVCETEVNDVPLPVEKLPELPGMLPPEAINVFGPTSPHDRTGTAWLPDEARTPFRGGVNGLRHRHGR